MIFSDKMKAADTEWKIKTFKQGKKNIADFRIKFEALAMKIDTDKLYVIFLLKKNVRADIIKTILGYPPIAVPKTLKELENSNYLSWTRLQINKRTTQLQNKYRNDIWRLRNANGYWQD